VQIQAEWALTMANFGPEWMASIMAKASVPLRATFV
jgi:hypothetical protein